MFDFMCEMIKFLEEVSETLAEDRDEAVRMLEKKIDELSGGRDDMEAFMTHQTELENFFEDTDEDV